MMALLAVALQGDSTSVVPPIVVEAQPVWPGVIIGVLTLAVLLGQLWVFRRQAGIMGSQAGTATTQVRLLDRQAEILRAQHDLAEQQMEWRRTEAAGTFYRLVFDLVAEFRKANVLPLSIIPADFNTHPRQVLREASRLFAPLGAAFVVAVNQAADTLEQYFRGVELYNGLFRDERGAPILLALQRSREDVGAELDTASRHIPPDARWKRRDGADFSFRQLCAMPPELRPDRDVRDGGAGVA